MLMKPSEITEPNRMEISGVTQSVKVLPELAVGCAARFEDSMEFLQRAGPLEQASK